MARSFVGRAFWLSILGALVTLATAHAQWGTISIVYSTDPANPSPYRCWHKPDGTVVDEVVYLDHSVINGTTTPIPFCSQSIAVPKVQYNSSGEMLIMVNGGTINSINGTANAIGDSISMVKRLTNGRFDTAPVLDPQTGTPMVMHFPAVSAGPNPPRDVLCPPTGTCDWSWRGGLGVGGGFSQTTIPTVSGYKYFAMVAVGFFNGYQYAHPTSNSQKAADPNSCTAPGTTNNSGGWITWAVSQDGVNWSFVAEAGGLTSDPAKSIYLIARPDKQFAFSVTASGTMDPCSPQHVPPGPGASWHDRFFHPTLFYNKYDNYFYIIFGWSTPLGPQATWWRMLFNPNDSYGLGPVEMLTDGNPAPNVYSPKFQSASTCTDGTGAAIRACIPATDGWEVGAAYPNLSQPNMSWMIAPADTMDFAQLYLCTVNCNAPLYGTTFDSHVFTYLPGLNAFTCPFGIEFIKGTSPVFPFFDPQSLPPQAVDNSGLNSALPNSPCPPLQPTSVQYTPESAGGGFFLSFAQIQNQADGAPSLTGFLVARRMDLHSQPAECTLSNPPLFCQFVDGLLPARFTLSGSGVYPVLSSVTPRGGPPSGGTTVTVTGVGFQTGATVKIGGVSATSVTVTPPNLITARTAGMTGGAPSDVVVTNSTGQLGKLPEGFLPDYTDVPTSNLNHDQIVMVTRDHIVVGCGSGTFCPLAAVTREQMAIFLLKSKYSSFAYSPIPATGIFTDVPLSDPFAPWVEELSREGITAGCGSTTFCPNDPSTRGQMSVFLLKAELGSSYLPPHCANPTFADVSCSAQFADWIYDAATRHFMAGCDSTHFCPTASVLRQEMAKDVVSTFSLP